MFKHKFKQFFLAIKCVWRKVVNFEKCNLKQFWAFWMAKFHYLNIESITADNIKNILKLQNECLSILMMNFLMENGQKWWKIAHKLCILIKFYQENSVKHWIEVFSDNDEIQISYEHTKMHISCADYIILLNKYFAVTTHLCISFILHILE